MNIIQNFLSDESGATMIEYGLLAALVAVALIGSLGTLQTAITGTFTDVGTALDGATGS